MSEQHDFLSRRRFAGMLAVCAALPASASAQSSTLDAIRSKGVMVIGNGGAFPPFEFIENGQLVGFDIDLGNEICRRLGVKAQWEKIDFSGLIAALTSRRVDVLITAMTKTAERAERIGFSTSYYNSGIAAASRANSPVRVADDLSGKVVAVQVGTAGERFVRDNYGTKVKQLKTFNEFPLAFADVEAGRADVVVNTLPVLKYNASRRGGKLVLSEPFDSRDVGINTRLADIAFLEEINRILAELKKEGFLDRLDEKWFK
jgi:polar amino acid transport system substrate-binding protein